MRKFTLSLLASTVLGMTGQAASAADMPIRKAPPPVVAAAYSWSGFYLGGHIGAGWSRNSFRDLSDSYICTSYDGFAFVNGTCQGGAHNGLGFIGGGQAGFNIQNGQFVFGVEGTYSFADIKGSHSSAFGAVVPTFTFDGFATFNQNEKFSTKIKGIATLAARFGIASGPTDRTLFYVKGGGAYMRQEVNWRFDNGYSVCSVGGGGGCDVFGIFGSLSGKKDRWGWMVGAGLEHGLFDNWSAKVEYNYLDFGKKNVTLSGQVCSGLIGDQGCFAESLSRSVDTQIHTITFGLNYRFVTGGR